MEKAKQYARASSRPPGKEKEGARAGGPLFASFFFASANGHTRAHVQHKTHTHALTQAEWADLELADMQIQPEFLCQFILDTQVDEEVAVPAREPTRVVPAHDEPGVTLVATPRRAGTDDYTMELPRVDERQRASE